MTAYERVQVKLSNTQKQKLAQAIKNNRDITLRFSQNNFEGDPDSMILFTQSQFEKLNNTINTGRSVDIKFSRTQLNKLKSGGFLASLLGGLAASVLPGLLGIGKGLNAQNSNKITCDKCQGSGVYLSQRSKPPFHNTGNGLWLCMNEPKSDRIYLKSGNKMYDISDVQAGSGIGTVITSFLPKILPVLKGLGKSLLGGLAIDTSSELGSQAIKAITGRKGSGLYLKRGGMIYDVTPIIEEMSNQKMGAGLLSNLFGFKSPFKNIPILGMLI